MVVIIIQKYKHRYTNTVFFQDLVQFFPYPFMWLIKVQSEESVVLGGRKCQTHIHIHISNIHKGLRSTANLHHKLWQKKLQNQCKRNKHYQKTMSEKKKVVDTEQKTFFVSTDVSNDTRLKHKDSLLIQ